MSWNEEDPKVQGEIIAQGGWQQEGETVAQEGEIVAKEGQVAEQSSWEQEGEVAAQEDQVEKKSGWEEADWYDIDEKTGKAMYKTATVKLFGKWSLDDVTVSDESLKAYISVNETAAKYLPHSAGRYQVKRFRKATCPIAERLVVSMMGHGRNNGKKLMAIRIVKHAFEIIHLLSGENPVQVLVNAVANSGPREDSTRIGRAGIVRRQAVDVSPLRRVGQAIWLICTGARDSAFGNIKSIAECLADELINAAKGSSNSYAIKKKDELERVAKSNR
jgi:small subunit ribosomal protein S5e